MEEAFKKEQVKIVPRPRGKFFLFVVKKFALI